MEQGNEFERLVRHCDLAKVLRLVDELKHQKLLLKTLVSGEGHASHAEVQANKRSKTNGDKQRVRCLVPGRVRPSEAAFSSAADILRRALVPSMSELTEQEQMMSRGECLITDSLIDETIRTLAEALKFCLDLKKQIRSGHTLERAAASSAAGKTGPATSSAVQERGAVKSSSRKRTKNKKCIAQKFSKFQTDILTKWVIENCQDPRPSDEDEEELSRETGLTKRQVKTWVANVRKRNLKATIEREKKPHHFLDYLFLAVEREREVKVDNPGHDFSFLENLPQMQVVISKPPAFRMDAQAPTKSVVNSEVKTETMDCDPASDDEPIHGSHPKAPSNAADIFRGFEGISHFEGIKVHADARCSPDFGYNDGTLLQLEHRRLQNARERALLDGFSSHRRDIDIPIDSFQNDQPRLEKIDANMFQDEGAAFDPVVPPPLPTLHSAPTSDIMMRNVAPTVSFGPSFDTTSSHNEAATEDHLMRCMNH